MRQLGTQDVGKEEEKGRLQDSEKLIAGLCLGSWCYTYDRIQYQLGIPKGSTEHNPFLYVPPKPTYWKKQQKIKSVYK